MASLETYESSYHRRNFRLKSSTNSEWLLSLNEIQDLKRKFLGQASHQWIVSDFTAVKIAVITQAELQEMQDHRGTMEIPRRLVIGLSEPLFLNQTYALLSYVCVLNTVGFWPVEDYTVLLKKNKRKMDSRFCVLSRLITRYQNFVYGN